MLQFHVKLLRGAVVCDHPRELVIQEPYEAEGVCGSILSVASNVTDVFTAAVKSDVGEPDKHFTGNAHLRQSFGMQNF
jgi:hypothetical protein